MLAGLPSINAYVAGLWVRARRYAYGIFVDDYEGYNSDGFWNAEDNPNWAYGTYYRTAAKVVFPKFDVFFVFTDVIAQTGRPYNIAPLFTADETLLTRAEARALLGDLDGALVDLTYWNRSHGSSPGDVTMELIRSVYGSSAQYGATKKVLTPIFNEPDIDYDSNTDKEYVIHAVLHAHRLETIYEGLRWFQIRRYGIEVEHVHEGGFPDVLSVGDLRRVFQIPGYVRGAGMTPNPRPEEEI